MTMLQYLREESRRLFWQGEAIIEQQRSIMQETTSHDIREGARLLLHDGLDMMRQSNALYPLIRMYEAQEQAYWNLFDKKHGLL